MIRHPFRLLLAVLVAASLVAGPVVYSEARQKYLRNFRVVEDRVLYRSGQPSPAGLERAIHDYGIRTVVSFRGRVESGAADASDAWEEDLCRRTGIRYVRIPLTDWAARDGVVPGDENVRQFLGLMADPRNHPVLAHCYRGVHRTGTFCAIYRMECHGWSNAEAIEELKALGYDRLDEEPHVRGYLERYAPAGKRSSGR